MRCSRRPWWRCSRLIAYPMYLIFSMSFREGEEPQLPRAGHAAVRARQLRVGADRQRDLAQRLACRSRTRSARSCPGVPDRARHRRAAQSRLPVRRWLRSLMLLPWAVPGVMVSIVFLWLFDASFGVVNYFLRIAGVIRCRHRVVHDRIDGALRGDRADDVEKLSVLHADAAGGDAVDSRRICTKPREVDGATRVAALRQYHLARHPRRRRRSRSC